MEQIRIEAVISDRKPDYGPLAEWILGMMQKEMEGRTDDEAGELEQGGLPGAVSATHRMAG